MIKVITEKVRKTLAALGYRGVFDRRFRSLQTKMRDRHFSAWRSKADYEKISPGITAVILTMEGSHLYNKSLESLRKQNLKPGSIKTIKDVTPFSKASQAALDEVDTPYYMPVDDDMILYPSCVERLYYTISSESDCAEAVANLMDPIMGKIKGVRIYRTEPVRKIGFYPLRNEKGCERNMRKELEKNGWRSTYYRVIEGDHHPEYLPSEAFYKFRLMAEKLRYYEGNFTPRFDTIMKRLAAYRLKTGNDTSFYAMAGFFSGFNSTNIESELDYEVRDNDPEFERIKAAFETCKTEQIPSNRAIGQPQKPEPEST